MTALLRNRRGVTGILFLVAIAGWAAAQTEKPAARPLDSLKNLPPGSIIVVCEDLNAGKQLAANLILLTPKQYQDMRDEIAQAKTKGQPEETVPSECKLIGKVDGDVVRFQAEFKFATDRDREQVLLACRMGQPTAVALDGSLPIVHPTGRGLVVLVEKKGEHVAKLDLEVNIAAKGDRASERGFELDLPGAAVTNLELTVPDSVTEAAVGISGPARSSSRLVSTRAEGGKRRFIQYLGPATSLEVSWKAPIATTAGPPQRTAQGTITIRVAEGHIAAEAEWKLKARGKPVAEWRLHVPENARVMVKFPSDDRPIADVEAPDGEDKPLRVIRLKDPSLDSITVLVQKDFKRGQGAIPIGPFAVEGADWQRGDVFLSAPADVRLRVLPRGMLSLREVSTEELRKDKEVKAAFTYWSVPSPGQAGQPYPPLLELDADSSRGSIEARVEHILQRTEENWKLTTVLRVTPLAEGVDSLSVQLPVDYRLQPPAPRSGEPAHTIKAEDNARLAEIKLEQRATRPFQITLEGTYGGPPPPRQVALELPQLQQVQGRGTHKIVIQLMENQELEAPRDRDPSWDIERSRYNRQTWTSERLPERIEFAWQPHLQELLLASIADVALNGRAGQVVQQIWFASAQATAETRFRVRDEIADLEVLDRGEWNPKTRTITLARDVSEKRPLRLRYSFAIRSEPGNAAFSIPLPTPAQESRCETKLRITCQSPSLAECVGGPWEEMPLERAAGDERRLASLVLRGERPEMPPMLRLSEASVLATIAIERALMRVWVNEQGQQNYRASFLLNPSGLRVLDLEFPASPTALNVRVEIGGLAADWRPVDDSMPRPLGGDPARIARVPLGGPMRKPTMLDVWYQIAPGQIGVSNPGWTRVVGPLKTTLYPPRLCGHAGHGSVRWQIVLPADWVPLFDDGALPADLSWAWRGWLVGTRPNSSRADLERWLVEPGEHVPADDADSVYASLAPWRTDLDPLTIRHAPQQAWLLGCSVGLLASALALYLARAQRLVFWPIFAGNIGGLLAIGLLWSGALSAVLYGCEPGLVALLIVAAVQWLLHRRYRRQVVFLPSFKRVKATGSVLIPNSGGNRPREPSTVDAIPPVPINQWAAGGPTPSAAGRKRLPGSSQTKAPPTG
jgi:hypothetical protein